MIPPAAVSRIAARIHHPEWNGPRDDPCEGASDAPEDQSGEGTGDRRGGPEEGEVKGWDPEGAADQEIREDVERRVEAEGHHIEREMADLRPPLHRDHTEHIHRLQKLLKRLLARLHGRPPSRFET